MKIHSIYWRWPAEICELRARGLPITPCHIPTRKNGRAYPSGTARAWYKENVGDPGDLHVLHLCANGHWNCINPDHLILGTHQENCNHVDALHKKAESQKTEQYRQKISASKSGKNNRGYGKTGASNPFQGPHTAEARKRIGDARRKRAAELRAAKSQVSKPD